MQQQIPNLSSVAAQLIEAACHARAGDSKNAQAHIARAGEGNETGLGMFDQQIAHYRSAPGA